MSANPRRFRDRNFELIRPLKSEEEEEEEEEAAAPAEIAKEAHQESELSKLSEVEDEGEPTKIPPLFDGSLSKSNFAASATARITRSSAAPLLATAQSQSTSDSSRKKRTRSIPVKKESPSADTTITTTTTRKRAKRGSKESSRYAPPEKYAHLGGVTDAFTEGLISVFIGLNPGIATATAGHAYASPTNHFWRFLYSSGLTPDRQCPPETDTHLPRLYSLGNTNLVARPTKDQAELSKAEMDANVRVCEEKIRKWRPESVCVVGKGIWESMWRAKHDGKKITKEQFVWGWQVDAERFGGIPGAEYEGARVFVVPSTSGLVAGYSMEFKRTIWKELGDWVQQRRAERGETAPRTDKEPKLEVKDEE